MDELTRSAALEGTVVAPAPKDVTPPTAPGLCAVMTSTNKKVIGIAWKASTDDVGVVGYDVYF